MVRKRGSKWSVIKKLTGEVVRSFNDRSDAVASVLYESRTVGGKKV